jgi:hypothetical protein
VRTFDPNVWRSISRKYRTVARLPEDMDAHDALEQHNIELSNHMRRVGTPYHCVLSQYLRVYAIYDGMTESLTQEEYAQFRADGGRTA